jgi:hypothetical protein
VIEMIDAAPSLASHCLPLLHISFFVSRSPIENGVVLRGTASARWAGGLTVGSMATSLTSVKRL